MLSAIINIYFCIINSRLEVSTIRLGDPFFFYSNYETLEKFPPRKKMANSTSTKQHEREAKTICLFEKGVSPRFGATMSLYTQVGELISFSFAAYSLTENKLRSSRRNVREILCTEKRSVQFKKTFFSFFLSLRDDLMFSAFKSGFTQIKIGPHKAK